MEGDGNTRKLEEGRIKIKVIEGWI